MVRLNNLGSRGRLRASIIAADSVRMYEAAQALGRQAHDEGQARQANPFRPTRLEQAARWGWFSGWDTTLGPQGTPAG